MFQGSLEDQLGRVGGQPAGADVRGHEGVTHQEAGQLEPIECLWVIYTTSIEYQYNIYRASLEKSYSALEKTNLSQLCDISRCHYSG